MIETIVEQQDEVKDYEYPKLMVSRLSGNVVLFQKYGEGTIVHFGGDHMANKFGDHANTLSMDNFLPFRGKVTLISK